MFKCFNSHADINMVERHRNVIADRFQEETICDSLSDNFAFLNPCMKTRIFTVFIFLFFPLYFTFYMTQ